MFTKVSSKGQTVIPNAIREVARIQAGDELEVGYTNGLVVMRKRRPLTSAQVRRLLKGGAKLPEMTANDEQAVEQAVARVRQKNRS